MAASSSVINPAGRSTPDATIFSIPMLSNMAIPALLNLLLSTLLRPATESPPEEGLSSGVRLGAAPVCVFNLSSYFWTHFVCLSANSVWSSSAWRTAASKLSSRPLALLASRSRTLRFLPPSSTWSPSLIFPASIVSVKLSLKSDMILS